MTIPQWGTEFIEVGDRAYAYIQAGGGFCVANAGLIDTEQGPIAIDALFTPAMTRAFLRELARTGKSDVRLLLNTHHHVDHTLGNALFDAPILAHTLVREEMQRVGLPKERLLQTAPYFADELAQVSGIRLPTITFNGELTIHDGEREIRLLHVGTAHTAGDTLVYLPRERLLYAGDVAFHYVTPLAFEGHIGNWIAVLDRIAEMDVDWIVPGHGPVGTKSDLREVRDYFALIRGEAKQAHAAGVPAEQAAHDLYPKLGRFGNWTEAERIMPNVLRLYQEFDGQIDAPLDLQRTFGGMARFAEQLGRGET